MAKKPDYRMLEQGFGLVHGLGDEFVQAVKRKQVPVEAIHRLVTPSGRATIDKMVDVVLAEWQAEQPQPKCPIADPDAHYRLHVFYAPLPSLAQLKEEFGENNVSNLFDGRPWEKHASCEKMDETPGERDFLVKYWSRETESEATILEMDALGYRPATHQEAYEFQKAHPDPQRQFPIVALGSFALHGDLQYVAVLDSGSAGRVLGYDWFDGRWHARYRFLFVRK